MLYHTQIAKRAIFASLSTLALVAAAPAAAQDADSQPAESEDVTDDVHDRRMDSRSVIIVTAAGLRQFDLLAGTSVLEGATLDANLDGQLGEVLADVPGVTATGFAPGASRPILRGFSGERVKVLVDGIGAIDVSNTSADHAVSIDPLTAESIEVLRGPAVLLYGSQAIGGAVNVIDKRIPRRIPTEPVHVDALFRADRFARRRAEDRAERAAEAFLDQLRRAASFRRRAHRAVVRIRASVCSRAFAKWIFVVDERRRAASLFAKGARRFERVLLSKTIRAWYFACDDVQRERAVFAKAARKLDVLRLRRWWREWRTVAGEGLAERAAARRAIRRWTKGSLGGAWRKWTSHVDRERVKARAARTHAAIKSAVARERTLRASWTSWREHVAYYRRASALVSKAYAKTCRLQKQSVFDQWLDFVREVEARKETLKRCVTSKRLLTSWFLDWYWKAFEGDISSALGAITDSAEDVIGTVYGDSRGVDRGVFQQWQMLGSSLEAMTARPAEDAARAAAEKWRRARAFRGEDEPDADSPLGDGDGERTPGTPSSEAFDRSGYASGASTPRADESFRSADALDLSLSRQSSVATPTRFADDADARRTPRTASTRRPSASARETLAMSSSSESDDGFARPSPTASSTASESRRRWTRAATDIDDDGTDEDASPDPRRLTRSPATRRR